MRPKRDGHPDSTRTRALPIATTVSIDHETVLRTACFLQQYIRPSSRCVAAAHDVVRGLDASGNPMSAMLTGKWTVASAWRRLQAMRGLNAAHRKLF